MNIQRTMLNKAIAAGNNGASIKQLQAYLQGASGDYAAIARDAGAAVSAAEQGGQRPSEGDLLRLADAQQRNGNNAGYSNTLEKLLTYYPKKDYWNAHLARLPRKPGFGDRFTLDVMRLRLASGTPMLQLQVDVVEYLGMESLLVGKLVGAGEGRVTAVVPGQRADLMRQTVGLDLDPPALHVFDKASGRRIKV